MSLQGPILIVAGRPGSELSQAFTAAGASKVIEVSWADGASRREPHRTLRPLSSPIPTLPTSRRRALCPRLIAGAVPYLPAIVRVREDAAPGPARRAAGCRRRDRSNG